MGSHSHAVLAATLFALCASFQAQAAVYKCTSETGGILFTDSACPEGYSTDLVVPDMPSQPSAAEGSRAPPGAKPEAPAPGVQGEESTEAKLARLEAEAKAARLEAELEIARLQAELDGERLRSLEGQLDSALQQPPVYGGIGVAPILVAPGHFAPCKKGSRHCGVGRRHFGPRVVPQERPSCGIVGCTPSIQRRLDRDDAPSAARRGISVEQRRHHRSRPQRAPRP